jgi:AraC-like DNA-binding protein
LYISANPRNNFTELSNAHGENAMSSKSERICIWGNRCLFLGYLPDFASLRRSAATVCIGLDEEFEISLDGEEWLGFRSALIPPNTCHSIRFSGKFCALLFMDLSSTCYTSLKISNMEREIKGVYLALREEVQLLNAINDVFRRDSDEALLLSLNQMPPLGRTGAAHRDERILKILELIRTRPNENLAAKELAGFVGMSVSSLEHLFTKEVGIPIHAFRIWLKLKMTVLSLLQGMSHTEAALRAGFFDSAHFTRTFRATFGLPPSEIFNKERKIRYFVDAALSCA